MADEKGVWTPANIVTCVRIAFIPVFMVVAALADGPVEAPLAVAAFVIYVTLSLTDKVDGYLARSRNEITDFGKFLDPIADKLLVFSALLMLLDRGEVGVWVVFVILVREFLVSALRMVGYDDAISIEHEDSLMTPEEGLRHAVEFLKGSIIREEKPTGMSWA